MSRSRTAYGALPIKRYPGSIPPIPRNDLRKLGRAIAQHPADVGVAQSAVDTELTNSLELFDGTHAVSFGLALQISEGNPAANTTIDANSCVSAHGWQLY
jgi:hypothetical protein